MIRGLLAILALAGLTACQSGDGGTAAGGDAGDGQETGADHVYVPIAGPTATPAEREACAAVGGEVRPAGLAGHDHCIQSFADAGASCRDDSDCTGLCLVYDFDQPEGGPATGQCQPNDALYGCHSWIEDGVVAGSICVD